MRGYGVRRHSNMLRGDRDGLDTIRMGLVVIIACREANVKRLYVIVTCWHGHIHKLLCCNISYLLYKYILGLVEVAGLKLG